MSVHGLQHVKQWLDKYLDSELAPVQRATVEAHLEQCPDCQGRLNQRRSLTMLLQEALPAAGLKPAGQFVAEVALQLKPAAAHRPAALPWSWQAVPLALLLAWTFLQTISVMSSLLAAIPGAEQTAQSSVQELPAVLGSAQAGALAALVSSDLADLGIDLVALFAPVSWGWLANLAALALIGLLYASWLAGWWARSQQPQQAAK